MPKLTRNRAVLRVRLHKVRLRVRQCLQMSTECLRNVYKCLWEVPKRVGLSRLYHGSIMYLSRHRLWVSIMYLSGVVHTSEPLHPSVPLHRRHPYVSLHSRHMSVATFCRNQSAPVGACRWRSVWTTSTHAGALTPVGTGRWRVLTGLRCHWNVQRNVMP